MWRSSITSILTAFLTAMFLYSLEVVIYDFNNDHKLTIDLSSQPKILRDDRILKTCSISKCLNINRCLLNPRRHLSVGLQPLLKIMDKNGNLLTPEPSNEFLKMREIIRRSSYFETDLEYACLIVPGVDTLNFGRLPYESTSSVELSDIFTTIESALPNRSNLLIFNFVGNKITKHHHLPMIASSGFRYHSYRPNFDLTIPMLRSYSLRMIVQSNTVHLTTDKLNIGTILMHTPDPQVLSEYASTMNESVHILLNCKILPLESVATSLKNRVYCIHNRDHYVKNLQKFDYIIVPENSPSFEMTILDILETKRAVPVITSDDHLLPFHEILNWHEFSITLAKSQMSQISNILHNIPPKYFFKLRRRATQVYDQYFSSPEKIYLTALSILEHRIIPGSVANVKSFLHSASGFHTIECGPNSLLSVIPDHTIGKFVTERPTVSAIIAFGDTKNDATFLDNVATVINMLTEHLGQKLRKIYIASTAVKESTIKRLNISGIRSSIHIMEYKSPDDLYHIIKTAYEETAEKRNQYLLQIDEDIIMAELSIADREMSGGNTSLMLIRNTNSWLQSHEKMSYFTQIQRLYAAGLTKMGRDYITHTTFNPLHSNMFIRNAKRNVIASICFHEIKARNLVELIFFVVHVNQQLKGYGTLMMNAFKQYIVDQQHKFQYILTYADNNAQDFFKKQKFINVKISPRQYRGFIKQYRAAQLKQFNLCARDNYSDHHLIESFMHDDEPAHINIFPDIGDSNLPSDVLARQTLALPPTLHSMYEERNKRKALASSKEWRCFVEPKKGSCPLRLNNTLPVQSSNLPVMSNRFNPSQLKDELSQSNSSQLGKQESEATLKHKYMSVFSKLKKSTYSPYFREHVTPFVDYRFRE
ncbi:exostosin family domain-containing protein [Ditylenchus destructor]|nr:exostosin family domain-containing protein [Ditylenchus destructor]